MRQTNTALANRYEGRLFTDEGRLCFVLDVDTESGMARVSYRADSGQQVVQMPIAEVGLRLSSSSALSLDGLGTTPTTNRIIQKSDGWFFTTREGTNGPFSSDTDAQEALNKHILLFQASAKDGSQDRITAFAG